MIKESTILALQSIAAILMAADYLFDERQRDRINSEIQRRLGPIRDKADAEMRATPSIKKPLVLSVTSLGIALLAINSSGQIGKWIAAALSCVFVLAFGRILNPTTQMTIAAILGLTTKFVIRCPKGSVFGLGFIFLLAAFACRWYNLP